MKRLKEDPLITSNYGCKEMGLVEIIAVMEPTREDQSVSLCIQLSESESEN